MIPFGVFIVEVGLGSKIGWIFGVELAISMFMLSGIVEATFFPIQISTEILTMTIMAMDSL